MSKVVLIVAALLTGFSRCGLAQNCALSGTPAWSNQVRNVIADCENKFPSPNGKRILRIDTRGQVMVFEAISRSDFKVHSRAVVPPAMASWSPSSDAFFVNDGEGSGMASVLRLFRLKDDHVIEDQKVWHEAVTLYRNQERCSRAAADPNVWGVGWSQDGSQLYILVQTTANAPCGKPGSFIGLTIKLADDAIVEQLSETGTKEKFRGLIPGEMYSK